MSPKTKNRVVVVGSSNTDLVLNCAHLPRTGETVLGGKFQTFAGGKGANQAVAAARANAQVSFIGARGEDDFGRNAARALKEDAVDIRHFKSKPEAASGVALIFIGGREKDNMVGVARSANDALSAEDVRAAKSLFASAAVVVAQLEISLEAVREAAQMARECGAIFLLNPAPARKLSNALLKNVGVITPNQTEAELLTGESDAIRAAGVLRAHGALKIAITLGKAGVLLCDKNGMRTIAAPKVKPIDTVGAGDCFCGWLAAGLARGESLDEAARRAVFAASLAVTRNGAQAGMPHVDEVFAFEANAPNH